MFWDYVTLKILKLSAPSKEYCKNLLSLPDKVGNENKSRQVRKDLGKYEDETHAPKTNAQEDRFLKEKKKNGVTRIIHNIKIILHYMEIVTILLKKELSWHFPNDSFSDEFFFFF